MASLTDQERAAREALKEERAQDAVRALAEYEAQKAAERAKTERLRALRLAREAAERTATQEKIKAGLKARAKARR